MRATLMLVSLSLGCAYVTDEEYKDRLADADTEEDCEEFIIFYADADDDGFGNPDNPIEACSLGDGMADNSEDCNDADPEQFPGAIWSRDADGDGYGDETSVKESCAPETGYTGTMGDCDDTDAMVSPGAEEDCSTERDDNCDGDTNAQDALGCTDYYADVDGDGFGGGEPGCFCEPTEPYTFAEDDDCDDLEPGISPDAEEACNDGIDNNCDGGSAGCGLATMRALSEADVRFEGTVGGLTGTRLSYGDDVDGDGEPDLLITGYQASELMVVSGPVLDGVVGLTLSGDSGNWYGRGLATGDLDGDDVVDVVLGAPRKDVGSRANGGIAALYWGPLSADVDVNDPDIEVWGPDGNAYLGRALSVGDLDGDGQDDLLLGALDAKDGPDRVGMVAIVQGPVEDAGTGVLDTLVYDDTQARIYGTPSTSKFGVDVTLAGDWNGDGIDDLVVSARGAFIGHGGLYGFESGVPLSGDVTADDADIVIEGVGNGSRTGEALARVDDLDGDGLDDLLVGAPERNLTVTGARRGAAYLLTEMGSGSITDVATLELNGLVDTAHFGTALASTGDVDGSGPGIAVGAPRADGGKVFLFPGGLTGTVTTDEAIGVISGDDLDDGVGTALVGNIDYDGDGLLDLVVGADGKDSAEAGSAAVFLGGGL